MACNAGHDQIASRSRVDCLPTPARKSRCSLVTREASLAGFAALAAQGNLSTACCPDDSAFVPSSRPPGQAQPPIATVGRHVNSTAASRQGPPPFQQTLRQGHTATGVFLSRRCALRRAETRSCSCQGTRCVLNGRETSEALVLDGHRLRWKTLRRSSATSSVLLTATRELEGFSPEDRRMSVGKRALAARRLATCRPRPR
jgi:hypothetical protein